MLARGIGDHANASADLEANSYASVRAPLFSTALSAGTCNGTRFLKTSGPRQLWGRPGRADGTNSFIRYVDLGSECMQLGGLIQSFGEGLEQASELRSI